MPYLDDELRGVLDEFLNVTSEHSVSVVLLGSYATGQVQENVDVDLIVIAKDGSATNVLRKVRQMRTFQYD